MGVIEGTIGPITNAGAAADGTDCVQTLTIDADGGTFQLGFQGFVTPAITWSGTNNTLLANINTAIQGSAEVQTLTFANIASGTFKLVFQGQETAAITWSGTSNTLRDRIDSALELLKNIGTSGVVTTVGTMTSGLGTMTVTFAAFGPQLPIHVVEQLFVKVDDTIAGPCVTGAVRTTPGVAFPPIGKIGCVAADDSLTNGVGTLTLTFSGANMAKKYQPLFTIEDNSLTGAGDLEISDPATTPGVTATARGALPGAEVVDTTNGVRYFNAGTSAQAPDWDAVTVA